MLVRLVLIFCSFFCGATAANCSYGGAVNAKELCIHVEKSSSGVSFDDAEKFCVQRGGHLASLHSQFDTNILLDFALATSCHEVWIGGKILSQNGSWTDGTPFDYIPHGFINELGGGCLAVDTGSLAAGDWHVTDCAKYSPDCFACETPQMMSDCADYFRAGYTDSGMYRIWFDGNIHNVYCSMDNGGGWTVFQDRWEDYVSFEHRTWKEYQNGFDSDDLLGYKVWIGLDLLHYLTTKDSDVSLRIQLIGDRAHEWMFYQNWHIEYTKFKQNFAIHRDPMMYSVGGNFSTMDRINDPTSYCMMRYRMGGWWYNDCAISSLNGAYNYTDAGGYGMFWMLDRDTIIHPRGTTMMLRPTSFPK